MEELEKLLGEELFKQVKEKIGDKKFVPEDANKVPLSRLNEKIEENKELKAQVETMTADLKKLGKLTKDNEEAQGKIAEMQSTLEKKEAERVNLTKQFKLKDALRAAGAKEPYADLLLTKFDLSKLEFEGDNIKGIDDLIKPVKETFKDAFGEIKHAGKTPKPGEPDKDTDGEMSTKDWLAWTRKQKNNI